MCEDEDDDGCSSDEFDDITALWRWRECAMAPREMVFDPGAPERADTEWSFHVLLDPLYRRYIAHYVYLLAVTEGLSQPERRRMTVKGYRRLADNDVVTSAED